MKLPIIVIKKKSYPLRPFRSKKATDLQNIKTKVSKTIKKKSNNLYNNGAFSFSLVHFFRQMSNTIIDIFLQFDSNFKHKQFRIFFISSFHQTIPLINWPF